MKLLLAFMAMFLATGALAADKPKAKPWQKLENCRYVERQWNDGDSFGVQCGKETFVARLYFVDTPESTMSFPERNREQREHFGVTLDDTLDAGKRAKDFVHDALGKPFIVLTKRAVAQGRSKDLRYYCLVHANGRYLHEVLLVEGLARVKGTPTTLPDGELSRDYLPKLGAMENQAHAQRKGAWARSTR